MPASSPARRCRSMAASTCTEFDVSGGGSHAQAYRVQGHGAPRQGRRGRHRQGGLPRAGRPGVRGEVTLPAESSTVWDANLYLKFADARMRPALDLMGRLDAASGARAGHAIYDLGCGAGNISRILAERFPQAQVIG